MPSHKKTAGQVAPIAAIFIAAVCVPLLVGTIGLAELAVVRAQAQTAADAAVLAAAQTARPVQTLAVTKYSLTLIPAYAPPYYSSLPEIQRSPDSTVMVSGRLGSLFSDAGLPGWAAQAGCTTLTPPDPPATSTVCVSWRATQSPSWTYPDQGSMPYSNTAAISAGQALTANLAGEPYVETAFTTTQGTGLAEIALRVEMPTNTAFFMLFHHNEPVWVNVTASSQPIEQGQISSGTT